MPKTDFNPKVSAIPPRADPAPVAENTNSIKNQSVTPDTYASSGSDPYKSLLSGQAKAEVTPIQEMLGSDGSSSVNASKRKLSGMDRFLEGFLMGDANPQASAADFEQVYVPALSTLLGRVPGIEKDVDGMRGIIDRYEGLEVTLESLIAHADATLRDTQTASVMRSDEIAALSEHKRELEHQLLFSREQREKANFYFDWAEKTVEEERERIRRESEWWNQG